MRASSPPPLRWRLVSFLVASGLTVAVAGAGTAVSAASGTWSEGAAVRLGVGTEHPGPAAPRANEAPPGYRIYRMPSQSMAPTITVGQNVLVRLFPEPARARPAVGSIVVSAPPRGADAADGHECFDRRNLEHGRPCVRSVGGRSKGAKFLKRIVAGPGDTVAIVHGRVIRNGTAAGEPYVATPCAAREDTACDLPHQITLPRNRYFLAGDNRGESSDSRYWGPVPRSWMIGEVTQIGVPSPTLFR